jgi:hypothetical protein
MESCRELFGKLKILTFYSQYIHSVLCFVCNNKEHYIHNLDIHDRNTRYGSDFHYPTSNLALYQKSTYIMGLKVFKNLLSNIKDKVHDIKAFKWLIKNFLYHNTFYTLEEYCNHNKVWHITDDLLYVIYACKEVFLSYLLYYFYTYMHVLFYILTSHMKLLVCTCIVTSSISHGAHDAPSGMPGMWNKYWHWYWQWPADAGHMLLYLTT